MLLEYVLFFLLYKRAFPPFYIKCPIQKLSQIFSNMISFKTFINVDIKNPWTNRINVMDSPPQYLADQLTLFQPAEGKLSPPITTGTAKNIHLPASLGSVFPYPKLLYDPKKQASF